MKKTNRSDRIKMQQSRTIKVDQKAFEISKDIKIDRENFKIFPFEHHHGNLLLTNDLGV